MAGSNLGLGIAFDQSMSLVTTRRVTLYHVWHRNMVQYIRFQQAIVPGCALASRCSLLLQGNSFCPVPVAGSLFPGSGPPSIDSLTHSTCAPGVVRHPTTAALLVHCLVVWYRQCWATVCIDRHPQRRAGSGNPRTISTPVKAGAWLCERS